MCSENDRLFFEFKRAVDLINKKFLENFYGVHDTLLGEKLHHFYLINSTTLNDADWPRSHSPGRLQLRRRGQRSRLMWLEALHSLLTEVRRFKELDVALAAFIHRLENLKTPAPSQ